MTGALLVVAAAVVAAGGVGAGLERTFKSGLLLQAVGAAGLAVGGALALFRHETVGAEFTSILEPHVGVDGLSGLFLLTLGVVAAPAALFAIGYLDNIGRGRTTAALQAPFVLSLALVVCARDPLLFLAGWELMTLVPAAIILVSRLADRRARDTVFVYLAVTHLGGVGTWVAVLLLASRDGFGGAGTLAAGSGLQAAVAVAALIGMGTKAGLMPFHVWLPRAHPIAPAPVSALMSGVMVKVALYGLIRVHVEWLGAPPVWLGVIVLALGAGSAVGGILYALFQRELKRLLALSSIENVGIVTLGLGACLLLRARGQETWAAFALAAALLHTLNHAVFKALLFLAAGAFERATGTLELDRLGGLLRRMPWTGAAFIAGAIAIAGLPPLNGFASEWLTLQSLLHVPLTGAEVDGAAGAIALGALASTAALAVFCFVKVVGLVLLGPGRTPQVAAATDPPATMRLALVGLAAACVVLGLLPGLLFEALVELEPSANLLETRLGLDLPGTGGLPTPALLVFLALAAGAVLLLRGRRTAAPAPTWACGQLVEPQLLWTGPGFSKPLRIAMEPLLRPERSVTVRTVGGVVEEVAYVGRVPSLIEEQVYRPLNRGALALARRARGLQSGRLGTYVAYLVGLVLVLLAVARLGLLQ